MKKRIASLIALFMLMLMSLISVTGAYYSRTITISGTGKLVIPAPTPSPTPAPSKSYKDADSLIERARRVKAILEDYYVLSGELYNDQYYAALGDGIESTIKLEAGKARQKGLITAEQEAAYASAARAYQQGMRNDYTTITQAKTDVFNSEVYKRWITDQNHATPSGYSDNAENVYLYLMTYSEEQASSYVNYWDRDNYVRPFDAAYTNLVKAVDALEAHLVKGEQKMTECETCFDRIQQSYAAMIAMRDELLLINSGSAVQAAPMAAPRLEVTVEPTEAPVVEPAIEPTHAPSTEPAHAPTVAPTAVPTAVLTEAPSAKPTETPLLQATPTAKPTEAPTPTPKPTEAPTPKPTEAPTPRPTEAPALKAAPPEPVVEQHEDAE